MDTIPDTSDGELMALIESLPPPSLTRSSFPPPTIDAAHVAVARAPTGTLMPPLDGSVPPVAVVLPSAPPVSPHAAVTRPPSASAAPPGSSAPRVTNGSPSASAAHGLSASRPPHGVASRGPASSASSLPPLAAPRPSRPAASSAETASDSSLRELLDHHATERPQALPTSAPPAPPSTSADFALALDEAAADSAPPTRTEAPPSGLAVPHHPIVVPAPAGARAPGLSVLDDEPPSYGNTLVGGWREPGLGASAAPSPPLRSAGPAPSPNDDGSADPRTLVGLQGLPGEVSIASRATQRLSAPPVVVPAPAGASLVPHGYEPRLTEGSARADRAGALASEPRSFGSVLDAALTL